MSTGLLIALVIVGLVVLFIVLGPLQQYLRHKAATSIEGNGLATPGDGNRPEENLIGPVVLMPGGARVNKSVGCPATLQPLEGAIGYVDIPQSDVKGLSGGTNPISGDPTYTEPDGHIHYATANMPVPAGAKGMECVFDIIADDGAEVRPRTAPAGPSMIALYMQRKGEDFSGVGEKVYYRWWTDVVLLWQEGVGWHNKGRITITAPFDIDHWFEEDAEHPGVPNTPERRQQFFTQMLAECQLIGFTCGGGDGKGHGFYAVKGKGNVRLVLVSRRFL